MPLDEQLTELHAQWKPFEAIALIRRELPQHRAKQYLHDHPAWHNDLAKWEKTLDDLEETLDDLESRPADPSG